MKRFLSLILVFIMVLSVASLPAFAASGEGYTDNGDGTYTVTASTGLDEFLADNSNKITKTIYLNCDVTLSAQITSITGQLIGKKDGALVKVVLSSASALTIKMQGNAMVKNIELVAGESVASINYSGYAGVLANEISSVSNQIVIENVVNNISLTGTSSAGFVGRTSVVSGTLESPKVKFVNCVNKGDMTATNHAGGILGALAKADDGGIVFEGCVNEGVITAPQAGGIFGGSFAGSGKELKFVNCENKGQINGTYCAGGIISGETRSGGDKLITNVEVVNCINNGIINSTNYAGGIVGYNISAWTISKCANIGNVSTTEAQAGGIAGQLGSSTVSECFNTGAITAGTNYAGGIAGNKNAAGLTYSITIENSYNAGTITAANGYAAGIIYSMSNRKNNSTDTDQTMVSVYNSGDINGEDNRYHICPIMHTGTNGVATVNNLYYTSHNNPGVSNVIYHTSYSEGANKDEYTYVSMPSTALKAPTENGFDTLPDGFDENIWVACEDGYPILKNNLPKNADGTDKEYYVVTLANGANGEALKSEETYVEKGNLYTLALVPTTGYKVDTITANGVQCEGQDNVYEISVNGDTDVVVTYVEKSVENPTSASGLYAVNAENYEIYAFAKYSIVEGNDVTDFGILLSFEETDDYTFNNTSLRKFKANSANDKGQYGIKLYGTLITKEGTYYCVPYVVYEDGTTCYGNDIMTIAK